jgi:hypothetical protein
MTDSGKRCTNCNGEWNGVGCICDKCYNLAMKERYNLVKSEKVSLITNALVLLKKLKKILEVES